MAGRPNILDPKIALEKAMLLFWEKGYTETSIAHLEEALGARRQSIYHAFGDKKSLFIKAYQHYLDTRLSAALNLLKVEGTPQEKLRHFFESSLDCSEEKHFGCFIGNTLATPAAQQEEVNQLTERAVQVFVAALVETLKPLYSDEKKCETVAWSFFTLFQGAQILAKQPGTRESLLHGIELFIDGLG